MSGLGLRCFRIVVRQTLAGGPPTVVAGFLPRRGYIVFSDETQQDKAAQMTPGCQSKEYWSRILAKLPEGTPDAAMLAFTVGRFVKMYINPLILLRF